MVRALKRDSLNIKIVEFSQKTNEVPFPGPCAKQQVYTTIICKSGNRYYGENFCNNPQPVCPREPGEDYEKCTTICDQEGHAEVVAIASAIFADDSLIGAHAYITGHDHSCRSCQISLFNQGISAITIGMAPPIQETE